MSALSNRSRWVPIVAWVVGGAFVVATHYCVCEALNSDHAHADRSHEHAPGGHHDETPSNNAYDPCCATLQAVVTPQASLLLFAPGSQTLFQEIPLQSNNVARFVDVPLAPSGLSPPAREPTPTQPFYRTTFASHAPPVCLA